MSSGSVKVERKLARMSNVWRALITKEEWKTRLVYTQLLKFFQSTMFSMDMGDPVTTVLFLYTIFYRLCSVGLVLSCSGSWRKEVHPPAGKGLWEGLREGMSCSFLATGNKARSCGFNFQ